MVSASLVSVKQRVYPQAGRSPLAIALSNRLSSLHFSPPVTEEHWHVQRQWVPDGKVTEPLDFLICSSFHTVLSSSRSKALLSRGLPGKSRLHSKSLLFSGILCYAPSYTPVSLHWFLSLRPTYLFFILLFSESISMKCCIVFTTCSFLSILSGPCSSGKQLENICEVLAAGPHNIISDHHNSFLR